LRDNKRRQIGQGLLMMGVVEVGGSDGKYIGTFARSYEFSVI